MKEHFMKQINANEKARRVGIAVASWLCGTIEGIAFDNEDIALAEALDKWLRQQKRNRQTLYTGCVVCESCGHSWESFVLSTDTKGSQCPDCGYIQAITSLPRPKPDALQNKDGIDKVQNDAATIILQIEELNKIINKHKKAFERQ
jgi:hypothetical protein